MTKALFVAFSVLLRKLMYRPTNVAALEKLLLDDMLVNNKVDQARGLPLLKTHAARGTTNTPNAAEHRVPSRRREEE
jgi:hypothetical protein